MTLLGIFREDKGGRFNQRQKLVFGMRPAGTRFFTHAASLNHLLTITAVKFRDAITLKEKYHVKKFSWFSLMLVSLFSSITQAAEPTLEQMQTEVLRFTKMNTPDYKPNKTKK